MFLLYKISANLRKTFQLIKETLLLQKEIRRPKGRTPGYGPMIVKSLFNDHTINIHYRQVKFYIEIKKQLHIFDIIVINWE